MYNKHIKTATEVYVAFTMSMDFLVSVV